MDRLHYNLDTTCCLDRELSSCCNLRVLYVTSCYSKPRVTRVVERLICAFVTYPYCKRLATLYINKIVACVKGHARLMRQDRSARPAQSLYHAWHLRPD
jgi:hypothetical protein